MSEKKGKSSQFAISRIRFAKHESRRFKINISARNQMIQN
eukprot:UN07759